jgi:hypothetical protein
LNLNLPTKGKTMKNLLRDRKGTAEVIGSILFIIILLFFFTNVYLWHDAAVKDANSLYLKQANAQMDLSWARTDEGAIIGVNVTAHGSDVYLSRLWIVLGNNPYFANLTGDDVNVMAGKFVSISFSDYTFQSPDGSSRQISYNDLSSNDKVMVVNSLGVTTQIRK